jgi:hypothetical protein
MAQIIKRTNAPDPREVAELRLKVKIAEVLDALKREYYIYPTEVWATRQNNENGHGVSTYFYAEIKGVEYKVYDHPTNGTPKAIAYFIKCEVAGNERRAAVGA